MDINLEKIELVKDRTGVSYNEAKEALELSDGSVVDAIVAIEEKINNEASESTSYKDSQAFKKLKEIVESGNYSQIRIKKNGAKIVSFPVTVGIVGTVIVPWLAVVGAVTALGTHCDIELVDKNGVAYDVNGKAIELYDKAKDSEAYSKAIDYLEIAKEKGEDLVSLGKEKAEEYGVKDKLNSLRDKLLQFKNSITVPDDEVDVVEIKDEESEDGDR